MTAEPSPRPPIEHLLPATKRIPADPRTAPARGSLLNQRRYDYGPFPHVIPGLFPVGLSLIVARGGTGKTTFSDQFALCVAGKVEVGGYTPGPDSRGWCLSIAYEGSMDLAVERSTRLYAWLSLDTDEPGDDEDRIEHDYQFPGDYYEDRLAELERRLIEAQEAGRPLRYVSLDPLRAWLGPVPRHANTAQIEGERLMPVNKLGEKYDCAIVAIAHVNKVGEFSGSEAIRGSCNAMYRLDREITGTDGKLVCLKSRAAAERNWPLTYDRDTGGWAVDATITPEQACKTGHQRAILDRIADYGPAAGPELCAEVAADTGASAGTIKNALARLAADALVIRSRDGLWCIDSTPVSTCEVCHVAMTVVQAGQTTHPNCEPPPAPPRVLPWGPDVPADYWQGDRGGELAAVIPLQPAAGGPEIRTASADFEDGSEDQSAGCDHCGLAVTPGDDSHDCGDPDGSEWPAAKTLHNCLRKIRRPMVKFIAAEGNPLGQGEGKQHRGMEQWRQSADVASSVVTGYGFDRRALVDQFGPDRMVRTFDKVQAFFSAADQPVLTAGLLEHVGPFDCDPRELGPASSAKDGRPEGLAGIAKIECPPWSLPGVPHPLGRRADPGEPITVPTGMLELLWRLHREDRIPRPVVLDSWLGPRFTRLFTGYAELVKAERGKVPHDSAADKAIKTRGSKALSMMRSQHKNGGIYRPDWYAAVAGESMIRLWIKGLGAVLGGDELVSMRNCDEVSWLVPEGADPETWTPAGYVLGDAWGQYRPKGVLFDPARVDSSIPADRVTRPASQRRKVKVAGPVPLSMWVHHA